MLQCQLLVNEINRPKVLFSNAVYLQCNVLGYFPIEDKNNEVEEIRNIKFQGVVLSKCRSTSGKKSTAGTLSASHWSYKCSYFNPNIHFLHEELPHSH